MYMSMNRVIAYQKSHAISLTDEGFALMSQVISEQTKGRPVPSGRVWTLKWDAPMDQYAFPILLSECGQWAFEVSQVNGFCSRFTADLSQGRELTMRKHKFLHPNTGSTLQFFKTVFTVLKEGEAFAIRQPEDGMGDDSDGGGPARGRTERFDVTYWLFDDDELDLY